MIAFLLRNFWKNYLFIKLFLTSRLICMDENIDKEKNESFLEILQNEEGLISKVDREVLFVTTDSWLAQLGVRRNN